MDVFDELRRQFHDRAAGETLVRVHRIWEGIEELGKTILNWTYHPLFDINDIVEEVDLNSMPYIGGAGLNTQKICLEGTRGEILDEITAWINNTDDTTPRVFWLHGSAGTGKSSISHTIADRFDKLGRLGSCFCFDRNKMAEQRHEKIFTTIARDLADRDDQIRRLLAGAIHGHTSLKNTTDILQQWKEMILKPSQKLSDGMTGPIVIVIDALDESGEPVSRRNLLRILAGKVNDEKSRIADLSPHFRILLTSRPLQDICKALDGLGHVHQKSMDDIRSEWTKRDILHSILDELSGFEEMDNEEVSSALASASDGLFEWARLACAYVIGDTYGGLSAQERFEAVIAPNKDIRVPLLDSMYKLTLETIFAHDMQMHPMSQTETRLHSTDLNRFRSVMAQIIATAEPLPLASLSTLRGYFANEDLQKININLILKRMGALLSGTTSSTDPTDPPATIRPLHASFPDFLLDKSRSGEFFVDLSHIHNELAFASLGIMKDELRFNICKLTSSYLSNSETPNCDRKVEANISKALSYACRFWTDHL